MVLACASLAAVRAVYGFYTMSPYGRHSKKSFGTPLSRGLWPPEHKANEKKKILFPYL